MGGDLDRSLRNIFLVDLPTLPRRTHSTGARPRGKKEKRCEPG